MKNNEDTDAPPPSIEQLADDGILAMGAGSDTTASALTSIFFCLLAHPSALANLQEEVDEYFPTGEDCLSGTAMEKHRGMVWLNAIVSVKVDVGFHD